MDVVLDWGFLMDTAQVVKECDMRHENGNCLPAGEFCTANRNICVALQNAYQTGYRHDLKKHTGGTKPCETDLKEIGIV